MSGGHEVKECMSQLGVSTLCTVEPHDLQRDLLYALKHMDADLDIVQISCWKLMEMSSIWLQRKELNKIKFQLSKSQWDYWDGGTIHPEGNYDCLHQHQESPKLWRMCTFVLNLFIF